MNPEIRVIRISDGSLLDADGMRLIAEMAEESYLPDLEQYVTAPQ